MIIKRALFYSLIAILTLMVALPQKIVAKTPAIIPIPKSLKWSSDSFLIPDTLSLFYKTDKELSVSSHIVNWLVKEGIHPILIRQKLSTPSSKGIYIHLDSVDINSGSKEEYSLKITNKKIYLGAVESDGILRGVQTLAQLLVEKRKLSGCEINDWPAFKWRGFMHDVGRNFIPLSSLRKQVAIMARYKLNIFHWHLTEDIAWRLEIKQYPELTQPANMIRNPGEYYTQQEANDFVEYCKQLGVMVLPEIDMPGHSDAFERAMGVDMQSAKGVEIVTNILHEVCQLFDLPFIHIGGDEVKITNKQFLPEMIRVVRSYGKEVVGWRPGGNLDDQVIQQLWTGNPKPLPGIKTVDSRHLYINHNDPLSGVIKTFNHKICDVDNGDDEHLGAILCAWPDRRVANENDIIRMNGVYPTLLAFAERSWVGGGYLVPTSSLDAYNQKQYKAFREFESRLIEHRSKYFKGIEFPYVKQTHIKWNIVEPFPNHGELKAAFPPENEIEASYQYKGKTYNTFEAIGGTVWLRHMWHPMIKGEFNDPSINSTSYAYNYVYSDKDQEASMWISFHNPGRANVDDTPHAGKWDYKESLFWINGQKVTPPRWSKPARKGHLEAPLIDESYEWREPTKVLLNEGWNQLLIKLPIGKFSSEHTRPVKWMFTAVFVELDGINVREVKGLKYALKPKGL